MKLKSRVNDAGADRATEDGSGRSGLLPNTRRERERERGEGESIEHCIDVLYDGKQRVVGAAAVVEEDNKQIVRSYIQITLMGKSGRE